jgi:hypothetical protein
LDPDLVGNGVAYPLLATRIAFGSLHGYVSEQKLNLIEFASSLVADAGRISRLLFDNGYLNSPISGLPANERVFQD